MKIQSSLQKIGLIFLFFMGSIFIHIYAQELNCNVQINTSQLSQQTPNDKKFFDNLQKTLFDFMNNRKWTNLNIGKQERIDCSIIITVTSWNPQTNQIEAKLAVQSRRPVFNSGYSTPSVNLNDPNFNFQYAEFDPIEFNDNNMSSNLTATLGFYSYLILGLHFDSFGNHGGRAFFDKAQNVVNLTQGFSETGWKSNEKNAMNRYWISEAFTNGNYKTIHDIIYLYNRMGMDKMYENPAEARANIIKAFEMVKELNKLKTALPSKQLFMESKVDEIISIFSPVSKEEKQKIMALLLEIDASNMTKYQKIMNPTASGNIR